MGETWAGEVSDGDIGIGLGGGVLDTHGLLHGLGSIFQSVGVR